MFAKKVSVKWRSLCHKCGKELQPGMQMLLTVYYPMFFNPRTRELVKGDKTVSPVCLDCLKECVDTIEAAGHYAPEFATVAQKKRMRAALNSK